MLATALELAFSVPNGRLAVLEEENTTPSRVVDPASQRPSTGRRSRSGGSGAPPSYKRSRLTLDPRPAGTEEDMVRSKQDAGTGDEERMNQPGGRRAPRRAPTSTRDGAIVIPEFQDDAPRTRRGSAVHE